MSTSALRMNSVERRCLKVIMAEWQQRPTGADRVSLTYERFAGETGLSPRHIKRGLDGLAELQIMERIGFVRGPTGHPRGAYRVLVEMGSAGAL